MTKFDEMRALLDEMRDRVNQLEPLLDVKDLATNPEFLRLKRESDDLLAKLEALLWRRT
jgi:hypothetical protein